MAKVTLEEALTIIRRGNVNKSFEKKLMHSVELLRKAEKLALKYDPENGFYNTFSGGKDSQAMFHVCEMAGVKFQTHMNFTSVDPPQVVRFVRKQYPEVITHAPKWSIYHRAVERGILPSMRIRWCCADFKETAGAGKVTLIGIRKYESARRAKRHEVEVSSKKFSGDLDEFGLWQEEEIKKKEAKLIRKMKREGKKVNEDEFSLQKDNEVRCINGKDSILISPIFEWTERDVWYFLNEVVKMPHCELYDYGYKRIGCILCPMSQRKQKLREIQDFPYVKQKWIEAIKAIRRGGGISARVYMVEHQREWGIGEDGRQTLTKSPGTDTAQFNPTRCLQDSNGSTTTGEIPPPPAQNATAKRLDREGTAIQRGQNAGVPAVQRHPLRGHWERKANTGIWAGFSTPAGDTGRVFGQPLC